MWPEVFDLKIGESHDIQTSRGWRRVKLLDVEELWAPDRWISNNPEQKMLSLARVRVEISGRERILIERKRATLLLRPYQLPVTVKGLRLYVENTYNWATDVTYYKIDDMAGDVRFSAADASQNWGPNNLVFPIQNYRWHSSPYNNTWSSLVPYGQKYYHRGEDFGIIPDRLNVASMTDGTVVETPMNFREPVAKNSNPITIVSPDGTAIAYIHMNIETIDPELTLGTQVKAGQVLGKTGSTWNGGRNQTHSPHLHIDFIRNGRLISTYPFLVNAYLRTYPDPMLPVAGGYYFTTPRYPLQLDASRSIARSGRAIASYQWRLHDGTVVNSPKATIRCEEPGLFTEELILRTDDGREDRDFAQVRAYNWDSDPKRIAYGWAFHMPVRHIKPGEPVLFWNRLRNTSEPVIIDFGDGSPPEQIRRESEHTYAKPGLYVVTLRSRGPIKEPVTIKMRVVVESGATKYLNK